MKIRPGPVTSLYVRTDWGLARIVYVPALFLTVAAITFVPALAAVKFKISIGFCGLCSFMKHWGHRAEEWINAKPLLEICNEGLAYEDGGKRVVYPFQSISGLAMQRRIRPDKTNGHLGFNPPVWLTLKIKNSDREKPYATDFLGRTMSEFIYIDVWPREIYGGLFMLRRFSKALARQIEIQTQSQTTSRIHVT
jgi:hypothetical protein